MKNKLSPPTIAASIILFLIGICFLPVSILGIYTNFKYFGADPVVYKSLIILVSTGIISISQIVSAIFLFKKRRWAHILGIIISILMIMITLFEGRESYTITLGYLLILTLLILGKKDFPSDRENVV